MLFYKKTTEPSLARAAVPELDNDRNRERPDMYRNSHSASPPFGRLANLLPNNAAPAPYGAFFLVTKKTNFFNLFSEYRDIGAYVKYDCFAPEKTDVSLKKTASAFLTTREKGDMLDR